MIDHPRAILIGNSFPLGLIRRAVSIEPRPLSELLLAAQGAAIHSFWGHANTLNAAQALTGLDLRPTQERPAITLDEALLPQLNDRSFTTVWILSPEYRPGYRPAIGEETPAEKILSWQVLKMDWQIS